MNTLAQALREALTELDTAKAIDSAYREMFSTFAKKPLRPGETWRLRLLQWCEREEALAPTLAKTKFDTALFERYQSAIEHWLMAGYSNETARALAAAKHGVDDDVKIWGIGVMKAKTNMREDNLV